MCLFSGVRRANIEEKYSLFSSIPQSRASDQVGVSQVALVVKQPVQKTIRDVGLIPGLGRSLGRGHGNPLQYPCLENPMDRGTWWAMVQRVRKSQTLLKWLTHTHIIIRQKYHEVRFQVDMGKSHSTIKLVSFRQWQTFLLLARRWMAILQKQVWQ